ncbi:MAG: hypothetical protein ACK40M_01655 [Flavobacteriales bacterium]
MFSKKISQSRSLLSSGIAFSSSKKVNHFSLQASEQVIRSIAGLLKEQAHTMQSSMFSIMNKLNFSVKKS